jgi:hypothetical protein
MMFLEVNKLDQPVYRLFYLLSLFSPKPEAVADVFFDGHLREESIRLKDHAGAASAGSEVTFLPWRMTIPESASRDQRL